MNEPRRALTPDALAMLEAIATTGSFAAAARQLGKVPSAVTYSVRQLEDALDVLLFDRRSRQARLTAAGHELLDAGGRLLEQIDAVANRVKRVATGWEAQLSIAADDIVSMATLLDLCEAFYAAAPPPTTTRLRLRSEVLAGTWEALVTGRADLAIGIGGIGQPHPGIAIKDLGSVAFVFAVAPHHPLARATEPIGDDELIRHRAVAVADSAERLAPITVHLLPGQEVLTVPDMRSKVDAQRCGIGCGFVPEPLVRADLAAGRLVAKAVQRARPEPRLGYAWRLPTPARGGRQKATVGLALRWWLDRLEHANTRRALLEHHDRSGSRSPRPAP